MSRLRTLAMALLAAALAGGPAEAADQVKTRVGEHEHYGRIAFDWPAPVTYEVKVEDATLTIRFARPFATKLDPIARGLDTYVESATLDEDGTTLTATLKRPVTLKTFTEGNTVAIDLVEAGDPARPAPAASRAAPTKSAPAKAAQAKAAPTKTLQAKTASAGAKAPGSPDLFPPPELIAPSAGPA
ncbi:MAG: hypothetical protein ACREDI_02465, partial [Roseiarcus sp.]